MDSTQKPPNSHECAYYGRKLSNVKTNVTMYYHAPSYISVGSENDDEISYGDGANDRILKERVKITVIHQDDEPGNIENVIEFDLEDTLKFAAIYCRGIYERVLRETEQPTKIYAQGFEYENIGDI